MILLFHYHCFIRVPRLKPVKYFSLKTPKIIVSDVLCTYMFVYNNILIRFRCPLVVYCQISYVVAKTLQLTSRPISCRTTCFHLCFESHRPNTMSGVVGFRTRNIDKMSADIVRFNVYLFAR